MNVISNRDETRSLLPYLQDGRHVPGRLSLTLAGGASSDEFFPFAIRGDADPLARIFEGRFLTDAGSPIKDLCLLVQRERYLIRRDELWPVTNLDVEKSWQRAFSFYRDQRNEPPLLVFSGQVDADGQLQPLSSLFYCKTHRLFFHPPCPACGAPLELCRDDELLLRSGLEAYSSSLKRYMFCAPCCAGGVSDFYTFERDAAEPLTVKDRWALVAGFANLTQRRDPAFSFPCPGCEEYAGCYGPEGEAASRIIPFSFYPFYLLVLESFPLNATDFLRLLGGASVAELLQNRASGQASRITALQEAGAQLGAGASFFQENDQRRFLEVLHLKLSFVAQVVALVVRDGAVSHPDLRPSIDQIFVRLAPTAAGLPAFWNFSVAVIGVGCPAQETSGASTSPDKLFYAGLIWFFALLANDSQNGRDVLTAVKEGTGRQTLRLGVRAGAEPGGVFAPEQLFFHPEGKRVDTRWRPLWDKALELGISLLEMAPGEGEKWSAVLFRAKVEALLGELKNSMFDTALGRQQETAEAKGVQVPEVDDEALLKVLCSLAARWRAAAEMETRPEKGDRDDEETRTVVLGGAAGESAAGAGTKQAAAEAARAPSAPPHPHLGSEVELPTTVVLGSAGEKEPSAPHEEEELAETVTLPSEGRKGPQGTAWPQEGAGEEGHRERVALPGRRDGESKGAEEEEDLPETVRLTPGREGSDEAPSAGKLPGLEGVRVEQTAQEEDDLVTRTVILRPGKRKDG